MRAKEAPNKYKAGTGSFVPWADPMVQRAFQLSDKVTDWGILARMLARIPPKEDKGILCLAKAESALRGGEAMSGDKLTIGEYTAARSLTAEVWIELAVARAGVNAPNMRRALGVILSGSNVDKPMGGVVRDAYSVLGRSLTAGKGDAPAVLASAVGEVKEVLGLMSEADVLNGNKVSKTGYDGGVTDDLFKWIADCPVAAADAIVPITDGAVVPMLVPALRERAAPKDDDEKAEDAAIEEALQEATLSAVGTKGTRTLAAFGNQRLPDFSAMIRKKARIGFPELLRWFTATGAPSDGDDKVTASCAVAMVMDVAMRAAEKAGDQKLHLWLPGAFMASTITFGTGRLGPTLTVGSPGGAPVPEGAAVLYALFDPPPPQTPAETAAVAEVVAAARKAGTKVVALPVGRVRRAGLAGGGAAAREALLKLAAARMGA